MAVISRRFVAERGAPPGDRVHGGAPIVPAGLILEFWKEHLRLGVSMTRHYGPFSEPSFSPSEQAPRSHPEAKRPDLPACQPQKLASITGLLYP